MWWTSLMPQKSPKTPCSSEFLRIDSRGFFSASPNEGYPNAGRSLKNSKEAVSAGGG